MSVSDILHPDGTDYDRFLFAEVGEDRAGATVTVLSALARLDLDPWTEARALARLGREAAQARLAAHLETITDIPALALACEGRAAKLIGLLPKRRGSAPETPPDPGPGVVRDGWIRWTRFALIGAVVLAWILYVSQTG